MPVGRPVVFQANGVVAQLCSKAGVVCPGTVTHHSYSAARVLGTLLAVKVTAVPGDWGEAALDVMETEVTEARVYWTLAMAS